MSDLQPYLIVGLVFVSCTGLFQWLFKQITKDKISFYDALFFAGLPALVRFVEKRTAGFTDSLPDVATRLLWFSIYLLLFYWGLRGWHKVQPKQAWLIIVCWVPLVTICIIAWYFANQDLAQDSASNT